MCGACPGGGRLPDSTVFLGLRAAAGRGARLLESATRGRMRVARFGDGWTATAPTGGMRTTRSFDEVAQWCAPFLDREAADELLRRGRESADEVAVFVAETALRTARHHGASGQGARSAGER